MAGKTLFEKVWQQHLVQNEANGRPALIYIDLHLIHEVTSPQAFDVLRERGLKVRRPDRTLGTIDHSTPTLPVNENGEHPYVNDSARAQVEKLRSNCREFGIELHDWESPNRGIVHVIGPELGATWPGSTIVCGDSHTSTHGAFGALAFGIGTSEVGHVLASQCLLQRKPKTMLVEVNGLPPEGTGAKDIILAIIGKIGVNGGTGFVLEYRGDAISALSMEERMTVCNMSIEAGARAGLIAPDEKTFNFIKGKAKAPQGEAWDKAMQYWQTLYSDDDAEFDKVVSLDVSKLAPQITYGTHPGMETAIDASLPETRDDSDRKAYNYMQQQAGRPVLGQKVDVVFIGSCTNSRLGDLRQAAVIFRNRKVADGVRTLVVPGSQKVKEEAEAEGLHTIFIEAGAEWREPGCSMCIAMNGDQVAEGQLAVSTSNRNFEGRQGKKARTMLASPLTAAAAAVTGVVSDPRTLLQD